MYKMVFLILYHFSKISHENKIKKYYIFIGYFKTGMGIGEGNGLGV